MYIPGFKLDLVDIQTRISINLQAFYQKCHSLIGSPPHYLFSY